MIPITHIHLVMVKSCHVSLTRCSIKSPVMYQNEQSVPSDSPSAQVSLRGKGARKRLQAASALSLILVLIIPTVP